MCLKESNLKVAFRYRERFLMICYFLLF